MATVSHNRLPQASSSRCQKVSMRIAGSRFLPAGVIAGPFAGRAFVDQIVRMHETLESDFRVRPDRGLPLVPFQNVNIGQSYRPFPITKAECR